MNQTCGEIAIAVDSFYVSEHSKPEAKRYVFAYRVQIRNNSKQVARLVKRHWVITDADGNYHEVKGTGVVGKQPSIMPGEVYEYTSGTILETPVGTMHGTYQLFMKSGQQLAASVAPFLLAKPNLLH